MNLDRTVRWLLWAVFALGLMVYVGAPILALSWSRRPFPGFVVEQTLVTSDYSGPGWSGTGAGLNYPQRVIQLGDRAIAGLAAFNAALSELSVGDQIAVGTELPDGSTRLYPSVTLGRFPGRDLARLFWLPYGVGLAYLLIGGWVYLQRREARTARAFAFFCVSTTLASGLLFDLITTHVGPALWSVAMAAEGGALIGLALLFPQESSAIRRWPGLLLLPYALSALLAGWTLAVLYSPSNPWAYVTAWRGSYVYAALGIIVLVGTMVYRHLTPVSQVARQQARIILWGSAVAFAPIGIWLAAPLFGVSIPFNTLLFFPFMLVFPLSIAFAILRYRLWEIDVIVRRTLVYGLLSVILASVYVSSVVLLQTAFQTVTGQTSSLAVAVSTLAIALLFNPLRSRVQNLIDRRLYRSKYDATKTLATFGAAVRNEVDLRQLMERLQSTVQEVLQPEHVYAWLRTPEGFGLFALGNVPSGTASSEIPEQDPAVSYLRAAPGVVQLDRVDFDSPALGRLKSAGAQLVVPLVCQAELVGWLGLGPRLSEQQYSADDRALLRDLAVQSAPAVRVAQLAREMQAEALERERLEQELRFARLIQQALLPEEMPTLPGWQVAAYWQPARAVGGDFYDFLVLPNGQLFFTIGDVADKGVPAALVMVSVRAILRGTARLLLSPSEALERANELLHPELPAGMFVTCLYAILDPVTGRLRYANAGHNLPYRRHDGSVSELWATGMALGPMPDMHYDEHETTIAPGESLFLYSDGLIEAHSPEGEMLDYPRLEALLEHDASAGPALIDHLLAELTDFTGPGWEQEDDVTLVVLQRAKARRGADA